MIDTVEMKSWLLSDLLGDARRSDGYHLRNKN